MSKSALYNLPAGWTWATLEEVADIVGGLTKGKKLRAGVETRAVPYLRVANVQRGYLDLSEVKTIEASEQDIQTLRLEPDDILFNEGGDRDKLGRGWIWEGQLPECIHQNHVFRARLVLPEIAPKFLSWWGNSFGQEWFMKVGKQSVNLASINLSNLRSFPVPIAPAAEQKRIIETVDELLSDLDAGVEALLHAQAKLNHYRTVVLKAAAEGRLTAEWRRQNPAAETASELLKRVLAERRHLWEREQLDKFAEKATKPPLGWQARYSAPTGHSDSQLPSLPEGWIWVSLGQLLRGIEAGKSFDCEPRRATSEEWGVIKVSAMTWGVFREDENKAVPPGKSFDPYNEIKAGDLLLSRSNTAQLVGAAVFVEACRHKLLLSDKSMRLLYNPLVDPKLLRYFLSSPLVRSQIARQATGTSDSMRNVSQEKVSSLLLPLVPSLEGRAIVEAIEEQLSMVDHVETDLEAKLASTRALRQSILHRAFTGQLVSQDPNDEPAEEMLKRIAAERARRSSSISRRRAKTT